MQASAVAAPRSKSTDSVVVVHGPSCSTACGILPDQGSNLCPLHWQADSLPLSQQGVLWAFIYVNFLIVVNNSISLLLIKAYSDFLFLLESVSMLCLSGNLSVSSKLFSFVDMLLFIVFLKSFLFL